MSFRRLCLLLSEERKGWQVTKRDPDWPLLGEEVVPGEDRSHDAEGSPLQMQTPQRDLRHQKDMRLDLKSFILLRKRDGGFFLPEITETELCCFKKKIKYILKERGLLLLQYSCLENPMDKGAWKGGKESKSQT